MNWIRVATKIKNDPAIGALALDCRVKVRDAVGLVICVLVELPDHARDGDLAAVDDTVLEHWALWTGKRGVFAAAFRARLCDADGMVKAWERHNGAAMREADRTRERAKEWREQQKERKANAVRTPYERGSERRSFSVDGTGRDVTTNTTADGEVPNAAASAAFRDIAPTVAPVGHDALRVLLDTVAEPQSWAGLIRGCASGQSMPEARPASPERLAAAVQDFVTAGHHRATPAKVKLFRGYVNGATASAKQTRYQPTLDDERVEQLRTLREQNERRRLRGEAAKPEPTWAGQLDRMFPDGRTHPAGVAA